MKDQPKTKNKRPTKNQTKSQKQKTNQNPQNKNLQSLLVLSHVYIFHTWGYWCAQTVRVPVFLCSPLPLTVNTAVPIPEWSSQIIHTIACTMDVAEYCLFVTKKFLSIGGVTLLFSFAKLTKPGVRLASFWDNFGTARNSGSSKCCCTWSEMALFHCALHSENTRITQALFY